MPTYEYLCDKCGQHLDVVQSFSDRPLRRHQGCGGDLERVFHPRGVVFKGSGFYATDSRPKSGNGSNGTKEDAPASKAEKTSTTSAAKSDSSADKSDSSAAKSDSSD
jgi:putative FmdB family regulatory protein